MTKEHLNSDTKERIFQSAAELFSEQGYTKVSVREICEKAGVAKPALYYYFDDKDALIEELVLQSFVILDALKNKFLKDEADFLENFKSLFLLYNEFANKYLIFTRFYMQMHFMAIPKKVKKDHIAKKNLQFEQLISFFRVGKKEGYFRKNTDVEMEATIFLGSVNAVFLNNYFLGEENYPLKKKLNQLKKHWIANFMNAKSEKV